MLTVGDLARFVLSREPQESAARLAFYNYLKNLRGLEENVRPELFRDFYGRALSVPHWQKNKMELSEEIENLTSTLAQETPLTWRPQDIRHARDLQVVCMENLNDLLELLHLHFEDTHHDGTQWKVLAYGERGALSIERDPRGPIRLSAFSRFITFDDGRAVPLCQNTVHYDAHLELLEGPVQHVEISPFQVARFTLGPEGVQGLTVRGFTFMKGDPIECTTVTQNPRLFYALKRLESHFINRATDPLYKEVVELLEKSTDVLIEQGTSARELALRAFERGQNALEQIFPDDKVLFLLLRDLARTLERVSPQEESCPNPPTEFV